MVKEVKSKQRVEEHGEVFTPEREVVAMCDLVMQETERIDSRFLEPACGDGNFLSVILKRKLLIVKKRYRKSSYDWERYSLLTLGSLYGVDVLSDNVLVCRKRLYDIWNEEYIANCKDECNDETRMSAQFVLQLNIVCGNALTMLCCDDNAQETSVPIIFSEWSFPFNDARMHRKDYTFVELLLQKESPKSNDSEGVFLYQGISHYRRLYESDLTWRKTYYKQFLEEDEKYND